MSGSPCFDSRLVSETCRVKPNGFLLVAFELLGFAMSIFTNGLLKLEIPVYQKDSPSFTAQPNLRQSFIGK